MSMQEEINDYNINTKRTRKEALECLEYSKFLSFRQRQQGVLEIHAIACKEKEEENISKARKLYRDLRKEEEEEKKEEEKKEKKRKIINTSIFRAKINVDSLNRLTSISYYINNKYSHRITNNLKENRFLLKKKNKE